MKYITDSATKIVIIPGEIELSPKTFQIFNRTRQAAKFGKDLRNSWEYPPIILPIVWELPYYWSGEPIGARTRA